MLSRTLRRAALFAILPLLMGLVLATPVGAVQTLVVADLTGAAEVPGPGDDDGAGFAYLVIDPDAGTICPAFIEFVDIAEPTAAHIHEGAEGVAGPPVVDLFDTPSDGFIELCLDSLDPTLLADIVANPQDYYVNVHNADFPDGAIRGQLEIPPPPPDCTPPDLCGSFLTGSGTAVPGAYVYGGFAADLSFTLAEPWISDVIGAGFLLTPPGEPGELLAEFLDGTVYTDTCGGTETTIPVSPQSYVDFLSAHPHVIVTDPAAPTTLGGASGVTLEINGTDTAGCPFGVALLFRGPVEEGLPPEAGEWVIGEGERVRIFLLDVAGQTVWIAVSDWAETDFDTLMARAQPILDSMVFALGGGPTPAPTVAPTAAPSLPNTAAARPAPESGVGALVFIGLFGALCGGSALALRRVRT